MQDMMSIKSVDERKMMSFQKRSFKKDD